jgi:hypothetical protein
MTRDWNLSLSPAFVVAVLGTLLFGCASQRLSECPPAEGKRCPPNFAMVRDADEQPTKVYRGGQLSLDDKAQYEYLHKQGITHIIKLNGSGSEARTERQLASNYGIHVEAFGFSAYTIGRRRTCKQVCNTLTYLLDPNNQPVYVHCTAGQDRTGYMIGLYEMFISKPRPAIISELAAHGHQGIWSKLFPQIDRELTKGPPPTCDCGLKWPTPAQ